MAYSRRGLEVGAAGGEGEQESSAVIGSHPGGEIGGGLVPGFALVAAPFHEQAVGQAGEQAPKQALGLVVLDVVVPATPAPPVGLTEFDPG